MRYWAIWVLWFGICRVLRLSLVICVLGVFYCVCFDLRLFGGCVVDCLYDCWCVIGYSLWVAVVAVGV